MVVVAAVGLGCILASAAAAGCAPRLVLMRLWASIHAVRVPSGALFQVVEHDASALGRANQLQKLVGAPVQEILQPLLPPVGIFRGYFWLLAKHVGMRPHNDSSFGHLGTKDFLSQHAVDPEVLLRQPLLERNDKKDGTVGRLVALFWDVEGLDDVLPESLQLLHIGHRRIGAEAWRIDNAKWGVAPVALCLAALLGDGHAAGGGFEAVSLQNGVASRRLATAGLTNDGQH